MAHSVYALGIQDAGLNPAAFALGAATLTTRSSQVDLGSPAGGGKNARIEDFEIEIQAPALTKAQAANSQTVTYSVQHSTASGSGYTALSGTLLTQTGAGGVGASASSVRYRVPSDCYRYLNVAAVSSAGAGNPSTASCTVVFYFHPTA